MNFSVKNNKKKEYKLRYNYINDLFIDIKNVSKYQVLILI